MSNELYYSIPDFWKFYNLNCTLLELYCTYNEIFYDNVILDSIYGSFPCIWNGGRAQSLKPIKKQNIEITIRPFLINNMAIRYTFTNCLLTEESLKDPAGNFILKTTDEIFGLRKEININSKIMEDYIRSNYPNFNIVYSTTIGKLSIDEINQRSENNILVLNYSYNNNFDFLKQLAYPQNIELIISDYCLPDCPYRQEHYTNESKIQLNSSIQPFTNCPRRNIPMIEYFQQWKKSSHIINHNDILDKYLPLGFNKFKIVGRNDSEILVIERYLTDLIKPEYIDSARFYMLHKIYEPNTFSL